MLATRIMIALASNVRDRRQIIRQMDRRRYTENWFYPSRFTPGKETVEAYLLR